MIDHSAELLPAEVFAEDEHDRYRAKLTRLLAHPPLGIDVSALEGTLSMAGDVGLSEHQIRPIRSRLLAVVERQKLAADSEACDFWLLRAD